MGNMGWMKGLVWRLTQPQEAVGIDRLCIVDLTGMIEATHLDRWLKCELQFRGKTQIEIVTGWEQYGGNYCT